MREQALRLLGLAPLAAAVVAAGCAAWELVQPRTAVVAVEPRCAGNECSFELERPGPVATLELEVAGGLPAGAVWEVCRGAACRPAIASLVRGRVDLSVAGASRGDNFRVRLRGAPTLEVKSARAVSAWVGWGTTLSRAAAFF